MKHIFKPVIIAMITFTLNDINMKAQTDEIQLIQSMYGMEKREIISEYMNLPAADAAKFWPIYDAYETERKKLGAERIRIISDYADASSSLTDEQVDNIISRSFKSDLAFDKLHKTYYAKLKKELGALKAAAFFQLELYLQSAIRFTIQDNIPFIGELEKKKKD